MARARRIAVVGYEGTHEVVENLGYNHDRDCYAKAVKINGEEKIVVAHRMSGPWRINKPFFDLSGIVRQLRDKERGEL